MFCCDARGSAPLAVSQKRRENRKGKSKGAEKEKTGVLDGRKTRDGRDWWGEGECDHIGRESKAAVFFSHHHHHLGRAWPITFFGALRCGPVLHWRTLTVCEVLNHGTPSGHLSKEETKQEVPKKEYSRGGGRGLLNHCSSGVMIP